MSGPDTAVPKSRRTSGDKLRDEVATQLFVKLFDPGRGRTAEYIAALSIEAADTFVATIHR